MKTTNKIYNLIRKIPPKVKVSLEKLALSPALERNSFYKLLLHKRKSSLMSTGLVFPYCVDVEPTNFCNADCIICPYSKMKRKKGYMDFSLFKKIVDECSSYPFVELRLIGIGEPLLDQNLEEKIAYAKQRGIRTIKVITNGSLLDVKRSMNFIRTGLDILCIDLDADSAESFQKIRKRISYQKITENIKKFSEIQKKMNLSRPILRLQTVNVNKSIKNLNKFIKYWKKFVDIIDINPISNWGGEIELKDNRLLKTTHTDEPCFKLWNNLVISWNGEVPLCCLDYNNNFVLGNLYKESIRDIWQNNFNQLRQCHLEDRRNKLPICRECNWKYLWWRNRTDVI